jgi:hypothetical protein
LAPLADRSPSHSHPPMDERPHHRPRPFSGARGNLPCRINFRRAARPMHAPRRLVRIIPLHAKSCRSLSDFQSMLGGRELLRLHVRLKRTPP